jgi:DNA-binding NarL/FixJ family response regulator
MTLDGQAAPAEIRIVIVDDHPAVREGLALLLAPEGVCVCGEASSRAEALDIVRQSQPHLALVDLSLGGEDGADLVEDLLTLQVPAIVYSMHEDAHRVEAAFAAGALAYVTKREMHGVLVQAIREAAAGRRFVSPNAALALAAYAAVSQSQEDERSLSEQESHVFSLLGDGEGTTDIAAAMGISTRTVDSYYARIMEKLGVDGMRELRRRAISSRRDRTP